MICVTIVRAWKGFEELKTSRVQLFARAFEYTIHYVSGREARGGGVQVRDTPGASLAIRGVLGQSEEPGRLRKTLEASAPISGVLEWRTIPCEQE